MRVSPLFRTDPVQALGFAVVALAMLLASPGVRATHAEENFSYDPALEAYASEATQQAERGAVCAAREAGPVLPLRGMPFLVADGEGAEGLNSLNGRGYNIGKSEPAGELRKLEFEVLRQAR